jgi:hypothetical protein
MPLNKCTNDGESGYKWGNSGKCYTGPGAKEKALKQGQAIEINKAAVQFFIEHEDEFGYSVAAELPPNAKLNQPFRTPKGPKKFAVYTKNEKGNVVLVRFGDSSMRSRENEPDRKKSFCARHNCSSPGPKWKAKYWSCKQWSC